MSFTPFLPSPPEVSPKELTRLLENDEPIQIMDVRAPERVAKGRIDLVSPGRFHNIRGSELIKYGDVPSTGLDPAIPVAVVCGHGMDSKILAAHLGRLGLEAKSLKGGLAAWMRFTQPRELDPPQGIDRFLQFDRIGKGCLGYLLVSDGQALVVDPPLVCPEYLQALEEAEAELVGVADTHAHADYLSGAPGLARHFGVPYYLHEADSIYPYDGTPGRVGFTPVAEGSSIEVGRARVDVVHTPGHTDGSVTYVVEDRAALTGDFLFVESIGRPDLGGKEEEWAGKLWASMARAVREWDNGLAIYPAHYASERERRMGQAVGIPFGVLLAENEILRIQDPEVFLHHILSQKAPFPDVYRKIKAINVGLAPIVESEIEELEVGRNECALGGTSG
ncbi:MAG: MBL fold metallo-hydrolase [Gemmatimonadetes bacterium]|nr:MBL fold metallo-hydrolase [Gemmatimonadota bacterium]